MEVAPYSPMARAKASTVPEAIPGPAAGIITFQNIRLYNDMSVIDNVKVGMHNSVRENLLAAVTHGFGYRKAERQAEATALEKLDFIGMADLAHAQAGSQP